MYEIKLNVEDSSDISRENVKTELILLRSEPMKCTLNYANLTQR